MSKEINVDKKIECFTSILGPGICLLTVVMDRFTPFSGTHCGLRQSLLFSGQSKQARDSA